MAGLYTHTPPPEPGRSFHPFPRLPYELRLTIWEAARPAQRLVSLFAVALPSPGDRVQSPDGYYLFGDDEQEPPGSAQGAELTGLLGANRESRRVTLDFYRVCTPLHRGPSSPATRPYRLNPETDFVMLQGGDGGGNRLTFDYPDSSPAVVRALAGLRRADPRGVGVVNLAVHPGTVQRLGDMAMAGGSNSRQSESGDVVFTAADDDFRRVLASSLRRVLLVHYTQLGRQHTSSSYMVENIPKPTYSRGVPLLPPRLFDRGGAVAFDLLPEDPRMRLRARQRPGEMINHASEEKEEDLRYLTVGWNPAPAELDSWRAIERAWLGGGGGEASNIECFLMYAHFLDAPRHNSSRNFVPGQQQHARDVYRQEVQDALDHGDRAWDEAIEADVRHCTRRVDSDKDVKAARLRERQWADKSRVPAAGFWLFAEEDLRAVDWGGYHGGRAVDLRSCRPRLGLLDFDYRAQS